MKASQQRIRRGGLRHEAAMRAATIPRGAIAMFTILTCLLSACGGAGSDPSGQGRAGRVADSSVIENPVAPGWIRQGNPPRKVAVVFIHGLFGDTTGSWTHPDGTRFFDLLADDPDVGDKVDVFAFGFTSNMFSGGSLNVIEAANALDQTLIRKRVWNYEQVVLVGHSMGGLVAMRLLIKHEDKRRKVPLLVLYSSPQEGSQISSMGRRFSGNAALRQLLPADGNDFLQGLDDDWSNLPEHRRPSVACAYETMGVGGVGPVIVKRSSATRYCGSERIAVGGVDHIDIVKPADRDSMSYIVLINALEKYALGTDLTPLLEMQGFAPEGDRLVYTLGDPFAEGVVRLRNAGNRPIHFTIVPPSNPKLMIRPEDTPKEIPIGGIQDLRFNLFLRGRSDPEYQFVLKVPSMPDRILTVRVPDFDRLPAEQSARALIVGQAVDDYLAVPANLVALQALPQESQQTKIAEIARDALVRHSPGLSGSAGWIIAADVLSGVGWPDIAGAALREARKTSPAVAQLQGFQTLAATVEMQSGEKMLQTPPSPDIQQPALDAFRAESPYIDRGHSTEWQTLSARMREVPALRQEGMTLQGDLLREQGDTDAASAVYQDASRLRETPMLKQRLRTTSARERQTRQ